MPSIDLELRPAPRRPTLSSKISKWTFLAVLYSAAGFAFFRALEADQLFEMLKEIVFGGFWASMASWWNFGPHHKRTVFSSGSYGPMADSWVAVFPEWIQRDIYDHQWHRRFDELEGYGIISQTYGSRQMGVLKLHAFDGTVEALEIADDVDLDELRDLLDAGLAGDLSAAA